MADSWMSPVPPTYAALQEMWAKVQAVPKPPRIVESPYVDCLVYLHPTGQEPVLFVPPGLIAVLEADTEVPE